MKEAIIEYSSEELSSRMDDFKIQGHLKGYIQKSIELHSHFAPGLIIGAYMVDLALEILGNPPTNEVFVISETHKCAPDAVQAILHCTTGNSKLQIVPTGRFSMIFSRRSAGTEAAGVRIFVDKNKLALFPIADLWFTKDPTFDKRSMNKEVTDELLKAGRDILSYEHVLVPVSPKREWSPVQCAKCHEMVPNILIVASTCKACRDDKFYKKKE